MSSGAVADETKDFGLPENGTDQLALRLIILVHEIRFRSGPKLLGHSLSMLHPRGVVPFNE